MALRSSTLPLSYCAPYIFSEQIDKMINKNCNKVSWFILFFFSHIKTIMDTNRISVYSYLLIYINNQIIMITKTTHKITYIHILKHSCICAQSHHTMCYSSPINLLVASKFLISHKILITNSELRGVFKKYADRCCHFYTG